MTSGARRLGAMAALLLIAAFAPHAALAQSPGKPFRVVTTFTVIQDIAQNVAGTIKAMPDTFDQLQAKGFKFVTVSELIAMGKPMPPKEPGTEWSTPVASPGVAPRASQQVPTSSAAPGSTNP